MLSDTIMDTYNYTFFKSYIIASRVTPNINHKILVNYINIVSSVIKKMYHITYKKLIIRETVCVCV